MVPRGGELNQYYKTYIAVLYKNVRLASFYKIRATFPIFVVTLLVATWVPYMFCKKNCANSQTY